MLGFKFFYEVLQIHQQHVIDRHNEANEDAGMLGHTNIDRYAYNWPAR